MSLLAGVLLSGLVGVIGLAVWAIRAELRIERSEWTEEQREQLAAIAWEALMAHTKSLPGVTGKPANPRIEWREPEQFVRIVQHRN